MSEPRVFPLEAIRTDGWFESAGENVGSFKALCEIIGERFFAFSMITGARITALTVDRRMPQNTLVDFVVAPGDEEATDADAQRLRLGDFRERLVAALLTYEQLAPPPERSTDVESIQRHIGVRFLLLAPLYGYSLKRLELHIERSELFVDRDGVEERYLLDEFQRKLRTHVRQDLERVASEQNRGAIDLSKVTEAETAAEAGDTRKVIQLLGSWAGPLTIFLRTPEGQNMNPETRSVICRSLGLLGSALVHEGEAAQGEEVLRLGVQYAQGTSFAADIFARLGSTLLGAGRPGEAIGPLRRAANLGGDPGSVWPHLARAFLERQRYLAALGAVREAQRRGVEDPMLAAVEGQANAALGAALESWVQLVRPAS